MAKMIMRVHARDTLNDVVYAVEDANSLPYISDETKRFLNSEAFLRSLSPRLSIGDENVLISFTLTERES